MQKAGVETLLLGRKQEAGPNTPLGSDWVDVLREIPLFAALSKRHVRRIANIARPQRFAAGAPIVRKGQRGESFFVILDGEATLGVPGRKAKTLGAGDFFGELALFDGQPRSANIRAKAPVLAMRIPRREFLKLVASDSDLALGLFKGLSERLRAATASSD